MARSGDTDIEFNQAFFDNILRSPGVDGIVKQAAERTASVARATAPVDTGDYRNRIRVVVRESRHRRVYRVVAQDTKSLIIESKTGNLARALKASRS